MAKSILSAPSELSKNEGRRAFFFGSPCLELILWLRKAFELSFVYTVRITVVLSMNMFKKYIPRVYWNEEIYFQNMKEVFHAREEFKDTNRQRNKKNCIIKFKFMNASSLSLA